MAEIVFVFTVPRRARNDDIAGVLSTYNARWTDAVIKTKMQKLAKIKVQNTKVVDAFCPDRTTRRDRTPGLPRVFGRKRKPGYRRTAVGKPVGRLCVFFFIFCSIGKTHFTRITLAVRARTTVKGPAEAAARAVIAAAAAAADTR